MLRIIIGCKIRLMVRTWLIAFNTMLKVNKKYINYIEGFTIPSNIYDGKFLRNYQSVALIRKLIS